MAHCQRTGHFALFTRLACLALVGVLSTAAFADTYVEQANAVYQEIPLDKRTETVMFPKLAGIDAGELLRAVAAPGPVRRFVLLPKSTLAEQAIGQWFQESAQTSLMDAIKTVTEEQDFRRAFRIGLGYGVEAAPVDLAIEELYIDLGDPPLLGKADFTLMEKLRDLVQAMHCLAAHTAATGEVRKAIDIDLRALHLSRQLAERERAREKNVGMTLMLLTLEQIRDLAYQDFRSGAPRLNPQDIVEINRALDSRRGICSVDRIRFADGERIAMEQLAQFVYGRDGRPDPQTFGPTMAAVTARGEPLRQFSEMAFWDDKRESQASGREVLAASKRVFEDWSKRWNLNYHDPLLSEDSDFERLGDNMAVIRQSLGNQDVESRYLRDLVRVEVAGTRTAMGVYGFWLENGSFPPYVTSIRPRFLSQVDDDPYRSSATPFQYFVPGRDTPRNARGEMVPTMTRVFPNGNEYYKDDGYPSFQVPLGQDQFVVYSVGPDQSPDWVNTVFNGASEDEASGSDYLIWPPMISLIRIHLEESGAM